MTKTVLIMPTYNGASYLKGQLDSIRQQTLPPDAVLFRDDCSSDETLRNLYDYIARFELQNWHVFKNEKNLGWRLNFRQLLIDAQAFSPEIIFFSDQDDNWHSNKNKCQLQVLNDQPEIELLTTDLEIVKTNHQVTENHYHVFVDRHKMLSQYPKRVRYKSFRPGWTVAVRNELVQTVLKYWTADVIVNHDALIEGIACLLGTGYNLNQTLGSHLRHDNNASGRPIISLHSTAEAHIRALYDYMGFFKITCQVLTDRESPQAEQVKLEYEFYKRRYEAALSKKKIQIFKQLLADWSAYENMSGRIRDVIFAFKK